jgi:uroporphyrinogen-III decarboxylase
MPVVRMPWKRQHWRKDGRVPMNNGKKWADLSPEEKREERFKRWLTPDVTFSSPEAEKGYKERVTRFIKAIKLEEPDRVPVMLPAGNIPAYLYGGNLKKVMYDYDELRRAWRKFLQEFEMDTYIGPGLVLPGKVLEAIDFKLEKWPGHGLPDDIESYQFIEGEYITADEYDKLIKDPSDFWLRTFLPRAVGACKPFEKLPQLTAFIGIPVFYIARLADPDIKAALKTLMDAADETMKWMAAVGEVTREAVEAGLPPLGGGFSGAPFDMIGDMLRGTRAIMMDMFQRPEKLHEAMERLVPIAIDEAVSGADSSGCPIVMMPLHKGTGGFMSNKQYETFYWPTFKKLLLGMIDEGLVPMPFAEGNYEPRLEIIKDMPRGSMIWWFEHMDMARAKEVLGDTACIAGNVPVTALCTGTPRDVKEHCRRLIETCAPGGGYILTGGASMDRGNPDNLRAVMEAAKEYGVYQR